MVIMIYLWSLVANDPVEAVKQSERYQSSQGHIYEYRNEVESTLVAAS